VCCLAYSSFDASVGVYDPRRQECSYDLKVSMQIRCHFVLFYSSTSWSDFYLTELLHLEAVGAGNYAWGSFSQLSMIRT